MDGYRGKILVAAPSLFDFFRRTLVLVIEHNESGAFGVVLNRRSDTPVGEAISALDGVTDRSETVRIGGPVGSDSVVVLGEFIDANESAKTVVGSVGVVDLESSWGSLVRARAFAGHAGWGPGQLDREVEDEAWLIIDGDPEYIFHEGDPWTDALVRRGGQWALLSTMPDDPSLN